MIKKNIKNKIILLFITAIVGINYCYAAGANFTDITSDSGGGGDTEVPYTGWADYTSGNKLYQFRYKKEIGTSTNISVNAYNLDGESVIPYRTKIDKNKYTFKSGTWVGVNVTEVKSVAWKVYAFEYQEVQNKYTCTYTKKGSSYTRCEGSYTTVFAFGPKTNCTGKCYEFSERPNIPGYGSCKKNTLKTYYNNDSTRQTTKTVGYKAKYTCPEAYPSNPSYKLTNTKVEKVYKNIINSSITTSMKNKAVNDVQNAARSLVQSTSGSVKYINNNNYPDDLKDIKYTIIEGGIPVKEEENGPTESGGAVSGNIKKYYEILEPKVCINVKTSKVTYGRDCDTTNGEMQIENSSFYDKYLKTNVKFWHYFIPLNTKSGSEFSLDIIKNENQVFNVTTCENFMKEHIDDYQNYIVPTGELGTFIGDYGRYSNKKLSLDMQKVKQGKGCNVSIKVSFPIRQEFYNEIENKDGNKSFNGFNFYYKPIDINNPFPNGLAKTSLWNDWSKSTTKKPNLTNSFNDITYTTQIREKEIRNYTKDNPYITWKNMYLDGRSSFIESKGIITRNIDKNSFYKLGCGPYNQNWKECKKS